MSTQTDSSPPRISAKTWKISAVTGAGAFMPMLDSTMVNVALESIRADLAATLPLMQWIATGYLIALAVSLPLAAWLGSRHGYGRVWAGSLAAFAIASALCALATGPLTLISARVLQGVAGGLMVPAGQAIIGSTAEPKQLGRIMGVLGLVVALGPAVGPAIGGVLLDICSWRCLFWINVPIGIGALIAARGLVPGGPTKTDRPLDRKGFVISIGLPLLLYGATETGATGVSPTSILAVATGLVLVISFFITTQRASAPLIDLRLLQRKAFTTSTAITGLTGANMFGGLLLLPLYLQLIGGQSTTETGFLLFAMGVGSALALPVGGTLTDHYGAGIVTLVGGVLLFVTTIPFLLPGLLATSFVVPVLVVRGVGMALSQMPAMTAAYASASAEEMGDASTLVNMVQRTGGALGAGGVVIILTQAGGKTSASAYFPVFGTLAALAVLTVVAAVILQMQLVKTKSFPTGQHSKQGS